GDRASEVLVHPLDGAGGVRLAPQAQPDAHHQPDAPGQGGGRGRRSDGHEAAALLSPGHDADAAAGWQPGRAQPDGPRDRRAPGGHGGPGAGYRAEPTGSGLAGRRETVGWQGALTVNAAGHRQVRAPNLYKRSSTP